VKKGNKPYTTIRKPLEKRSLYWLTLNVVLFLAHLSWKLKWAFLIIFLVLCFLLDFAV
jgi:hypothetical protein